MEQNLVHLLVLHDHERQRPPLKSEEAHKHILYQPRTGTPQI
jgi:hypothetical protein